MTPSLAIVGAGAAGIMAALEAARLGARVHLYDTNERVGRKLLVTGNGRCNLCNLNGVARRYDCADRRVVGRVLARCSPQELLARFGELGIPTYATDDGWCYPVSNSAASVVAILAGQIRRHAIDLHLQTQVVDIGSGRDGVTLTLGGGDHHARADAVIVACGGTAYPALGSRGALLPVLASLGHEIVPTLPALAPITTAKNPLRKLQGVRLDATLTLFSGQRRVAQTRGNILFTAFGLSGPGAMDLSHHVNLHRGEALVLQVDLLDEREAILRQALGVLRSTAASVRHLLMTVFAPKAADLLADYLKSNANARLDRLANRDVERLLAGLASLRMDVTGTRGPKFAQLSTGGVPVSEVDADTLASRCASRVYLAGEVLDVVGPCGGYNLLWAFASGIVAGRSAAAALLDGAPTL